MPWKQEKGLEEQRESFITEVLGKEKSFGRLCREYQISRKTGYKWCRRAFKEGAGALADRRRGPREGSAGAVEARWKSRIIEQKKVPQLGDKKAFCPFGPFTSWGKDSFTSHNQPNPEAKWLGAEWS
jgi:transposase